MRKYVSGGGKLLISGKTGLWDTDFNPLNNFILSDLMGVSFTQIHTEYAQNTWSSYIKKTPDSSFNGIFDRTTPPVSDFFIEQNAQMPTRNSRSYLHVLHVLRLTGLTGGARRRVPKQLIRH